MNLLAKLADKLSTWSVYCFSLGSSIASPTLNTIPALLIIMYLLLVGFSVVAPVTLSTASI